MPSPILAAADSPSSSASRNAPRGAQGSKPPKPLSEVKETAPGARLDDPSRTLYIVDISSFIFRAFHAIRMLTTRQKEPVNAVYGVATMLARLVAEARPEFLAVAYDSKEPSFRKEVYAEYKANRPAPPDELIPQFGRIDELVRCLEIPSFRQAGVEADDLIATLTRRWQALDARNRVVIVTSDKDLMQLVGEEVSIWDTMGNKFYGPPEVRGKFGVGPEQIRDYLALVGDSSDNIPGVPGIGPKTAAELLGQFGTLEGTLEAAAQGKVAGKKGQVLVDHAGDARLSARLATVQEDCPVEVDRERLAYRFHVTESCADLLRALEFHTLLSRWSGQAEVAAPVATPERRVDDEKLFRTINTREAFQELLKEMERAGRFGFDVETTSLNPREAELVGVAICTDPAYACYIPVGHRGTHVPQLPLQEVLEGLRPFLENSRHGKIGQNLKYDWSVLAELGIEAHGIEADTMVAAYVLDPSGRHNLESLAAQYLDYQVTTYEQVCGKGKDQIGFDQVPIDQATRYSAEDALIAVRLWALLKPRLEAEKLTEVYSRVDLPLVEVLFRMERQGVCIDVDYLKDLSAEFSKELRAIEERIQAYTRGPVNLNSPKQLGALLFEELKLPVQSKTKTGYSTDAQVLDALAPLHEVPKLLLEYREISKLQGTYVDPLPGLMDRKTGRIHASFHQTVAATGRLSSSDPNLQNIPIRTDRGMRIRRAFTARPGNVLVGADYSQIELRLLAHMSGDPELLRAFRHDEDVHRRTAGELFGVAPEEVSDRQRGIAKAINFGLMYGKSAFGLSQELKIPRKEAQDVINRYFERYAAVKRFLNGLIESAREKGFASTLMGRKRQLPDIRARNPAVRANAERMAMNTPIQGTAADLMKLAMTAVDQELLESGVRSRLIIQVHDELILDCPESEADAIRAMVCRRMVDAMSLDVPLRVNSASGRTWMDI